MERLGALASMASVTEAVPMS
uniref:Uncharacterized protein n=1 Tax=Arundo donax TaxID=35708 RepID=A0A0A9SIF4_ARUDO